jgi:MFS family permease
MLIAMIWNFSLQLGGPFFSVYQVEVLNSTPGIIGLLSMASALSRLIGQQFWGRVVDRRGSRWTLTLCTLIIPFLPFLWIPMTKPWHVIFVTVPSGFLWAGHELANFNLLLALPGEPQRTTRAAANYATLVGLANIAGPILGGRIIEATNYHWDFILSGMGRLLAGILFMLLLRPFKACQPCEG